MLRKNKNRGDIRVSESRLMWREGAWRALPVLAAMLVAALSGCTVIEDKFYNATVRLFEFLRWVVIASAIISGVVLLIRFILDVNNERFEGASAYLRRGAMIAGAVIAAILIPELVKGIVGFAQEGVSKDIPKPRE